MRSWKFLLPLLASSLCFAAQPDRIPGPIDSSQMVALKNHVSPFAQPAYDQGQIESSSQLEVSMLFTPTSVQQRALQNLLAQLQDPKSPNFHRWLTPEQYADRFGLSQNDVSKIEGWLGSLGFKVVYVARGRDSISFSGNAELMQSVFKTEIHRYDINGKTHFANSTQPLIPAALAGIVAGFRGLHNFFPHPQLRHRPDYTITISGQGTFTFLAPGDIATIYDINPLYQATTPIDGTGQKMVIVGQTDIYLADLNDFRGGFGLSSISTTCHNPTTDEVIACNTSNFRFVTSSGGDPGFSAGDLGESDLDIEWAGSVARNAQIIFVTSALGVDDSASYAIDNQLAPVISESYGLCEALNTAPSVIAQDLMYQKAASLGISFFAAAGDEGAAACDGDAASTPVSTAILGQSVSYPASSPEVTGVGGTEFDEGSVANPVYWGAGPANSTTNYGDSALKYIPELAWNDTTLSLSQGTGLDATGGGPSNCVNVSGSTSVTVDGTAYSINICDAPSGGGFAKPSYQKNGVTPADGVRDVPDISFSASNANDPYIVCAPQSEVVQGSTSSTSTCVGGISTAISTYFSAFGGTSASTPVAAGMAVLLNQYLGGAGLGNINTQLYKFFSSNPSAFHDIDSGTSAIDGDTSNNIVACTTGTPTFEPSTLRCPSGDTLGYSAGTGYDTVTGLGSIDFNVLFLAWKASLDPDFQFAPPPVNPAAVPAGQSTSTTLTISPITGSSALTVNFAPSNCTGLPTGASCSFNPTSVYFDGTDPAPPVVLTITTLATTPLGTQKITIVPTNSPSTSTSVMLTVTATNQSFSIASNAKTYSVVPGGTAQVQLTVAGTNGFVNTSNSTTALPVTYTCLQSSLPTEVQCSFSPTGGAAVSSTSLTLNITTTGPTSRVQPPLGHGSRLYYALLLPGLFGIVFASGSRRRGARLLGLIVVLGVSSLGVSSCGGSSGGVQKNAGTPAGTYAIVVNATTAGPNALTAPPLTVNLTVQ